MTDDQRPEIPAPLVARFRTLEHRLNTGGANGLAASLLTDVRYDMLADRVAGLWLTAVGDDNPDDPDRVHALRVADETAALSVACDRLADIADQLDAEHRRQALRVAPDEIRRVNGHGFHHE